MIRRMVESIGTPTTWATFLVGVTFLLVLDLFVLHRKAHEVRFREAVGWSLFWVALSLAFWGWIHFEYGPKPGLEFLTGYLIEKALSVDNIFVFLVLFRYFAVPAELQHRVLFWGVLGAIVLRAVFILLGTALLARFEWVMLVFGAFLLWTGWKILSHDEVEIHPESNPVMKLFRRFVPMTDHYAGQRFTVVEAGRRVATPLLLVLAVVEGTDVIFAVDSIPAIFGVTTDPYLVFTSNILAILGLRALYFVLAGMMHRFHYLNVGLGLVLMFVGVKMLIADWFHVPIAWSLGTVVALIGGSVLISWLRPTPRRPPPAGDAC